MSGGTFFQVKAGPIGDRLILRNPSVTREIASRLETATGIIELPKQITVGNFRKLDDPPGAWCFIPLDKPLSIASLDLDMVRDRICEDLAIRLKQS